MIKWVRSLLDYRARFWEASADYNEMIERYRSMIEGLQKERDAWMARAHEVETERNELREQLDAAREQGTQFAKEIMELKAAQFKSELEQAAAPKKRNNRAKSPDKEEL